MVRSLTEKFPIETAAAFEKSEKYRPRYARTLTSERHPYHLSDPVALLGEVRSVCTVATRGKKDQHSRPQTR